MVAKIGLGEHAELESAKCRGAQTERRFCVSGKCESDGPNGVGVWINVDFVQEIKVPDNTPIRTWQVSLRSCLALRGYISYVQRGAVRRSPGTSNGSSDGATRAPAQSQGRPSNLVNRSRIREFPCSVRLFPTYTSFEVVPGSMNRPRFANCSIPPAKWPETLTGWSWPRNFGKRTSKSVLP